MDIKFIEFLYLPDEYIVIEEDDNSEFKIVTTNFVDMINKLRNKYISYRSRIKLSVYNLKADGLKQYGTSSFLESKNLLAQHAYHRYIYLSIDLTEIYAESFSLWNPPFNISEPTLNGGSDYYYDYGLLYGNYPCMDNKKITTTYFEKDEDEDYNCIGKVYTNVYTSCKNINDKITLYNDINVSYICDSLISATGKNVSYCLLNKSPYTIIPVATFI